MKIKFLITIFTGFILSGCAGVSSKGLFGTGVSVALDPRTLGTQIDDSIMQKSLAAKILTKDKKYFLSVKTKVIDGRIYITGKVDDYFVLLAYWFVGFRVLHSLYHIFINGFLGALPIRALFFVPSWAIVVWMWFRFIQML